jgi:hypothetical protein
MIMPVRDKTQWVKTDLPDVDPLLYYTQPGRLIKKRIRGQGESHVAARASKKALLDALTAKLMVTTSKGVISQLGQTGNQERVQNSLE